MAPTLCALLTAYLLEEFVLPAERIAKLLPGRWQSVFRGALAASISCLLLGACPWWILLAILLARAGADIVKKHTRPDSLTPFLSIQCAHFLLLLALAWRFPDAAPGGVWLRVASPSVSKWYLATLSGISGLALCVPAGGVLIARLIGPLADEIRDNDFGGLKQGGRYIGWLERTLVLLLVLMGQPNGIGFLIAAKSILRFGEIKDASQRKVAEYIIIGTFLSFGWALSIAVLTQRALRYWLR